MSIEEERNNMLQEENSNEISPAKLVQMMNNKDPKIRIKALEHFLQQEEYYKKRQFVVNFLKDPDLHIAKMMLDEVTAHHSKFFGSVLRELSAKHKNPIIRIACLRSLIAMKAIKNAVLFIERIPYEKGEVRKELIDAVITFTREEPEVMTKHIIKTFTSEDPDIRRVGFNMFVNLPNKNEAMKIFYRFCLNLAPFMRDQFIQEVVNERDAFVELVLLNFKNETDSNIKYLNLKLAKLLKHERLADMFLHELNNKDWLVRYVAILALGEMRCKQAVAPIMKAISDVNVSVAAIKAIGDFEDPKLASQLLERFPSASRSERLEILKIASRIADKSFIEPITNIIRKETLSLKVRMAAEECILTLCQKYSEEIPYVVEQSINKKKLEAQQEDHAVDGEGISLVDEFE